VKINSPEMYCQYCTSFSYGKYNKWIKQVNGRQMEIDEDEIEDVDDSKIKKQFCARDKQAESGNLACNDFVLHPFFYCKKGNQSLDIVVCIARQQKQIIESCFKCSQGKMIKQYIESKEEYHEHE